MTRKIAHWTEEEMAGYVCDTLEEAIKLERSRGDLPGARVGWKGNRVRITIQGQDFVMTVDKVSPV